MKARKVDMTLTISHLCVSTWVCVCLYVCVRTCVCVVLPERDSLLAGLCVSKAENWSCTLGNCR